MHGANRLASNSLTEAVISGRRLARQLDVALSLKCDPSTPTDATSPTRGHGVDAATRDALATTMSSHAGVVRDRIGLEHVLDTLGDTGECATESLDLATLEATNLHTVSLLVAHAALLREESRGSHRRSDFPETSDQWVRSVTLHVCDDQVVARNDVMVDA